MNQDSKIRTHLLCDRCKKIELFLAKNVYGNANKEMKEAWVYFSKCALTRNLVPSFSTRSLKNNLVEVAQSTIISDNGRNLLPQP